MRPFIAFFGLAVGVTSMASAQLASPDTGMDTPVATVAAVHTAKASREADPYAPLWHCREEVRSFLSVSTQSVSSRQQALEECIAAAERRAHLEVAGD